MSEHDIEFAKAAFNSALPEVEYRAGSTQAPRPRNGRKAAVMAGTSIVAAAALFAFTSATTSAPAWSATPSALNNSESAHIDQVCRAASTDIIVIGNDASSSGGITATGGDVTTGSGTTVSGGSSSSVTVSGGNVSGGNVSGGGSGPVVSGGSVTVGAGNSGVVVAGGGQQVSHTESVGSLPLLLIDSRGKMALALYGDSTQHVMCNVDADGNASISPDSGAWQPPSGSDLISANAGVVMGTVQAGDNTGAQGTMQIVGTVAPSVKAMSVDVPGVGTVVATIAKGYYSLFIPNSMVGSSPNPWDATITKTDGSVVHQQLSQGLPVQVSP
jgi:hypothetical protein